VRIHASPPPNLIPPVWSFGGVHRSRSSRSVVSFAAALATSCAMNRLRFPVSRSSRTGIPRFNQFTTAEPVRASFRALNLASSAWISSGVALSMNSDGVAYLCVVSLRSTNKPCSLPRSSRAQLSHMLPDVYLSAFPKGTKSQLGVMPALKLDSEDTQRAIRFYKEHGTVIDPTIAVFDLSWRASDKPIEQTEPGAIKVARELAPSLKNTGIPGAFVARLRAGIDGALAFVVALHRAGVPIVVGTDQTVPGYSVYREMELYVAGGMSPMDAIQAATIIPARVMKLDRDSGTVEAGKRADLIVVDANPLESISNIRAIRTVFANGRMFDTAPLWRSVGFIP
jgi:Amidohydrolase family